MGTDGRAVLHDGLLDDADALHDFHHPAVEAVPTIADHRFARGTVERRQRNVEVVVLVPAVRLGLAQVPRGVALRAVQASTQHRPGAAVIDGHRLAQHADAGGALHEDLVLRQQGVVLGYARLEVVEELLAALQPTGWHIVVGTADGQEAVRQPCAADRFEEIENLFPFAEGIEERAEAAEIQAVGTHAHEVRGDAVEFTQQHADDLGLLGDDQPAQLLDGEAVAEVHVHRGEVVHPIRVRDELDGGDVLADLLRTAVQVAEVRHHAGHQLAVGLQHQPQHAVRTGVLRPHAHQHLVGADIELDFVGFGDHGPCPR